MDFQPLLLLGAFGFDDVFGFVCIGGVTLLVIGGIFWSFHAEKKRREAWQGISSNLGLDYRDRDDRIQNEFGRFKLFQQGRSRQAKNVLRGSHGGTTIVISDYQYTTGSGKNNTTHRQTICILHQDGLDLPHAFLRKESTLFDFLGKLFGGQDINFEDDREFSNAFVLQGENEQAVREVFTPEVRAFFVSHKNKNIQFECRGDTIVYHTGKRIKPDQAKGLLEEAFEMLGVWG